MCGDVRLERRPRGPQLDLRAVALGGELAESGGDDLGGRSGCGRVVRAPGVEGVDQPRPGHVREERVDADVRLEGCLCEADDAEPAAPRLRLIRVVEEDEAPGAEVEV